MHNAFRRPTLIASLVLTLAFSSSGIAQKAEPKGQRVFSAGHSFHVFVPGILNDIAKNAGIKDHVPAGLSSIGGSRVIQHWDVPEEKNKAKEALRSGKVDVLTLSPIYLPDDGIEKFVQLAVEHNPDIRVTVQEFWLPFDMYEPTFKQRPKDVDHNAPTVDALRAMHAPYFKSVDEHVVELNKKHGKQVVFVVPVGQAVIALREKIIAGQVPGLEKQADLFTDAIGHAKPPLQALVAYCHFAVVYRQSPVGLPLPAVLQKAKNPNWDEKLNRLLQELAWAAAASHPLSGVKAEPTKTGALDIGNRLELFVDDYLIAKLGGTAKLKLQKPVPQDVVFTFDRPWEGNTCAYFTLFRDGDLFRMYYRGSHHDGQKALHPEFTCYAESKDGIHWTRPNVGLHEFKGSKENNIVWIGPGAHNFTPFKDTNPKATPDALYKAIARTRGGLLAHKSADAVHWTLMSEKPVITKGAFDSQNLAFWDRALGKYREYHRIGTNGFRDIATCTSDDFLTWTEPVPLSYPGAPTEHLYTNAIRPYDRAPHLLLGFPTRFLAPTQQVEPQFMSSRDGLVFHRWTEPVIPMTAPKDRDWNRSNYMAWGVLDLSPSSEGGARGGELSVYATEAYYAGPAGRLRRFTYRTDGFVSVNAPAEGELLTKPLRFQGEKLVLNYVTGAKGSVRAELLDENARPIPGFSLADCAELHGDAVAQGVAWKGNLGSLVGRTVQVRFVLRDADLYSMRFQ